jgi:succinate dehydrogenase flavin-adding protein (antitoxin of CptAB toxin-antitoxin module)
MKFIVIIYALFGFHSYAKECKEMQALSYTLMSYQLKDLLGSKRQDFSNLEHCQDSEVLKIFMTTHSCDQEAKKKLLSRLDHGLEQDHRCPDLLKLRQKYETSLPTGALELPPKKACTVVMKTMQEMLSVCPKKDAF